MWFLFGLSTLWILSLLTTKTVKAITEYQTSSPKTMEYSAPRVDDEYILLCYVINYEDGTEEVLGETTDEDIEDMDEIKKIDNILIKYMFNGKFMQYVTRTLDIQFPIYSFNVEPETFPYYPDIMFMNDIDVTDYVRPFLGPLCNFYSDREEPVKLTDALKTHPKFKEFNFEEGTFKMISNKTPLNVRKLITKNLPSESLVWKRHAAVDPRDEHEILK